MDDRISDLPDDLLLRILGRLQSTAQAARTSVLSRRWCRVWVHVPELFLTYGAPQYDAALVLDRVDAALAACSAAAVGRLEIAMPYDRSRHLLRHIPVDRVARWLRFASQRLTGELRLSLGRILYSGEKLVLPICERITAMELRLLGHMLEFRLPVTSAFSALVTLRIEVSSVNACELENVLSCRCPHLKELYLRWVSLHITGPQVFYISCKSLERLELSVASRVELHVDAPDLQIFTTHQLYDAYIAAPKLSEVIWYSYAYDPSRQRFTKAGSHLRRLQTNTKVGAMALMKRFDTVDELQLSIDLPQATQEYGRFREVINKLANCKVLVVEFFGRCHTLKLIVLQILSKCTSVRKLVVILTAFEIRMPLMSNHATAELVSSWLRFAALRLAGELVLWLPAVRSDDDKDANQQDVVVPPCERVTAMGINYLMVGSTLWFPLSPAAGAFTALTLMKIRDACVDGRELGRVVSFCCPRLKEIVLTLITLRDEVGGLSIRSCSLERLEITYRPTEGRLQVATPELRSLTLDVSCDVYVLAPLSELEWRNYCYEPNRHRFQGAGSHLRRLGVSFANSTVVPLMQQFHTVDELDLTIIAPELAYGNESIFLHDIKDVAKSEVLVVRFIGQERVFKRTMLHLLTKFPGIRNLVVILNFSTPYYETYSLYCCPKSRELLALDSLEDVEIRSFKGSSEELEFLEQLYVRRSAGYVIRMSWSKPIFVVVGSKCVRYIELLTVECDSHSSAHYRLCILLHDSIHVFEHYSLLNARKLGTEQYNRFLEDVNQLTQCNVLNIGLYIYAHAVKTTLLHLLRKCTGVRKLVVDYLVYYSNGGYPCMWPGCSCKWLDSTEKVALDALEEIVSELETLLCSSNVTCQKRMIITVFEDRRINTTQTLTTHAHSPL
ncbi:hypothetical protein EJB05_11911, partial [Eragrostis curvula]